MSTSIRPRKRENHEFIPSDYFRRLEKKEIFENEAPLEVDLGCGEGTFLLDMAEKFPERNFIGVERLLGRVRKVSRRAELRGLTNVKVLRLDSKYVAEWLLPLSSISRVHLLCPDPWPKEKHHRHRLFRPSFLNSLESILEPGGEFLFKTDHDEYYEWSLEQANQYKGSLIQAEWPEDAFFYPKTDFQRQWEAEGKSLDSIRMIKPANL